MLKAVLLEIGLTVVAAAATAWWFGARETASLLLGAASCLIPNLMFLAYLWLSAKTGCSSSIVFFLAEFIKILVVMVFLVIAYWVFGMSLVFMLVGLVVVTKANLFALLLKN